MKKLLMATAAIGSFAIATPALADGDNMSTDTETYTIQGENPAKCNVVNESQTFTLPSNSISNNDGFVDAGLAGAIATRLNNAAITAWCTGNSNALVLSRSALTTGDGNTTNGFSQAAIYDLDVDIADSHRANNTPVLEGTSDGPGNGPGAGVGAAVPITRFGPTGNGSQLTFSQEAGSTVGAAGNGANSTEAARSSYVDAGAVRLVAGQYTGTVTVTLTPGV